jgi:deazaflavin-dependent oxidoreductase (nitroreductase family)
MSEERRVRNQNVVDEFRANRGVVGGFLEGVPVLLLHHTGARSGAAHISPLAYLPDGERWVIYAANGGRPTNPGWYYNLKTYPRAAIEVGTSTHKVRARVAEGAERTDLADRFRESSPFFADFERQTDRVVPVIVLEREDADDGAAA